MGRPRFGIHLLALAGPALLASCAAPGALTVASTSFDGFSYATTGKSLSDQAISQASARNCSTLRIFVGRPICRDYTPEEQKKIEGDYAKIDPQEIRSRRMGEPDFDAMAMNERLQATRRHGDDVAANPSSSGTASSAAGDAVIAAVPGVADAATSRPRPTTRQYLVLASFTSRANAEHAVALYPDAHPSLVSAMAGGRPLYRIVSGPFDPQTVGQARAKVEHAYGIHDAWTMPSCVDGDAGDGCVAMARASSQFAVR